jgi:hypothetical protein
MASSETQAAGRIEQPVLLVDAGDTIGDAESTHPAATPDPVSIPLPSDDEGLRRRTGGSTTEVEAKASSTAPGAGSRMRSPLMEKLKLPPMPSLQIPSGIEVKSVAGRSCVDHKLT